MDYKVTVISPCYNSEKTLNRCVDSIISQTIGFENIELILYDDASADNTRKIIKSYSEKYENIIPIFSDVNHGPGYARNQGIKFSTSEYIMFIDSDDEYDSNLCKLFYDEISSKSVDLVCCKIINIWEGTLIHEDFMLDQATRTKIKKDETLYFNDIHPVNKIYKKSLILKNDILFPEHEYSEDFYFNVCYFSNCDEIIYFSKYKGYLRYIQNDSISSSWNLNDLKMLMQTFLNIYHELKRNDVNFESNALFKLRVQYILFRFSSLILLNNKRDCIDFLRELLNFEYKINFNANLDNIILGIANRLILKEKLSIAYYYFKFLENLYKINIIKKFYRKLINLRQ